jgi:hypothetical protein
MWRLRHRLIVTYVFIDVIPIMLLLLMAGAGSYLLAGQFATYIAISNLQSELQHLEAANDALAAQLSTLELSAKLNPHIAGELAGEDGSKLTRPGSSAACCTVQVIPHLFRFLGLAHLPHPSRRFAERCLDTFVEVTLSKAGDRKV